jgi:hypothetical protein
MNDLVMILNPSIRKTKIRDKKTARYYGPFKVLGCHSHNTYTLESESGQRYLIHACRLRKFIPRFPTQNRAAV